MYYAKTEKDELIFSLKWPKQVASDEKFFCVTCGGPVQLKTSTTGKKFFAHRSQKFAHGETPEHQAGKNFFLGWGQQQEIPVLPEISLAADARRGDLYLPHEKKVLEIQCSPMSQGELKQRMASYQQHNIQVQWILGQRYLRRQRLGNSRVFLQYQRQLGFYLLRWVWGELFLYYQIHEVRGKLRYHRKKIAPTCPFLQLFTPEKLVVSPPPFRKISPNLIQQQELYRQQRLALKDRRYLQEQGLLYTQGLSFATLPQHLKYLTVVNPPYLVGSGTIFHWQLLQLVGGKTFTWEKLFQLWQPYFIKNQWRQGMPLITPQALWQSYCRHTLPLLKQLKLCQYDEETITFFKI